MKPTPATDYGFMTLSDLARQIGMSTQAIYYHRKTGKIPVVALDGRYIVPMEAAKQIIKWRKKNPSAQWPTFPLQNGHDKNRYDQPTTS